MKRAVLSVHTSVLSTQPVLLRLPHTRGKWVRRRDEHVLAGELPLTLLFLEPCLCRILVPLKSLVSIRHWSAVRWCHLETSENYKWHHCDSTRRSWYRCQVFSYQMIQNKAAAGRTESLPETQTTPEILYLPLSIKNTTSSLRCFRLLQDITMLLLNTLKSKWSKNTIGPKGSPVPSTVHLLTLHYIWFSTTHSMKSQPTLFRK